MPTILGKKYKPDWMGMPPRMSKEDYEIWQRYRGEALKDALWVFYDVGLGEGSPVEGEADETMRRMWLMNTQKRADVIIQYKTHVEIVELRYSASANGVGRLLMYEMLYMRAPVLGLPVKMTLVTDRKDQEVSDLCKRYNIKYVVV